MLTQLYIQNIVLIEKSMLDFQRGFCVFTGETGAGKSILLDAILLISGKNADYGLVRTGQDRAVIIADFITKSPLVKQILEDAGIEYEVENDSAYSSADSVKFAKGSDYATKDVKSIKSGGHKSQESGSGYIKLSLKRVLNKTSLKTKAFINDIPVSTTLLKQVSFHLIEIIGQFASKSLLEKQYHINFLDNIAIIEAQKKQLRQYFNNWQSLKSELASVFAKIQAEKKEEEFLTHSLKELKKLCFEQGEEEKLLLLRKKFMKKEKLLESCYAAIENICGISYVNSFNAVNNYKGNKNNRQEPAMKILLQAEKELLKIFTIEEFKDQSNLALKCLEKANIELENATEQINNIICSYDEEEEQSGYSNIDDIESRLFRIREVARKHNIAPSEIPKFLQEVESRLNNLKIGEENLENLQNQVKKSKEDYYDYAVSLGKKRRQTALEIERLIKAEFEFLHMPSAEFKVQIKQKQQENWNESGIDDVVFLARTNFGFDFNEIYKSASGGELSRILLALKVIFRPEDEKVMIFDEIDTGISGKISQAVGNRLKMLANLEGGKNIINESNDNSAKISKVRGQVFAITHQPQVAAKSDSHFYISKKQNDEGKIVTSVKLLSAEEKMQEVARLFSGKDITPEAIETAKKLILD